MTVWVVLVPFLGVLLLAAGLGLWLDRRRGTREVLLHGDPARARATVHYYVHVQDSMSG